VKCLNDPVLISSCSVRIIEKFTLYNEELQGTIDVYFNNHKQSFSWEKRADYFCVEKSGQESTGKGHIRYEEKMCFHDGKKDYFVDIQRGSIRITKKKVIFTAHDSGVDKETIEVVETKEGDELIKRKTLFQTPDQSILEIDRKRRGEQLKKKVVKKGNYFHEELTSIECQEVSEDCPSKTIGKFFSKGLNSNYEVSWIMTDIYFLGKITTFNNQQSCFNTYKYSEKFISETISFKITESNWGIIENFEKTRGFSIKWTGELPEVFKSVNENMVSYDTKQPSTFRIDKEGHLEDYKQQGEFLFKFTGTMTIGQIPKLSGKKNHLKSIHQPDEVKTTDQIENIRKILLNNLDLNFKIMKTQKIEETRRRLEMIQNKNGNQVKEDKRIQADGMRDAVHFLSKYHAASSYGVLKQLVSRV
jgi:hypothetical protein